MESEYPLNFRQAGLHDLLNDVPGLKACIHVPDAGPRNDMADGRFAFSGK